MRNFFRQTAGFVLAAGLGIFAAAATAQTVTLESSDGSIRVEGRLIAVQNDQYILETATGRQEFSVHATLCSGAACPVPEVTIGADVVLKSLDGQLSIQGKLVSYANGTYMVETKRMGKVAVRGDLVTCSGDGCLRFAEAVETVAEAPATATPAADPAIEAPVVETATEQPAEQPAEPVATAPEATVAEAPAASAPAIPDVSAEDAKVRFAGSDNVGLGLMPSLMEDYATYLGTTAEVTQLSENEAFARYLGADGNEITSFYVNSTGSGEAFDALEAKTAEFGMTSRPQKDEEADRLTAAGSGDLRGTDNETVIAVDSLAVITNSKNPVKSLTRQQIGDMYLGKITNWSEVGGPDAPITVLSREDGSSTRGVFEKAIFAGEEPVLSDRVVYPNGDSAGIVFAVEADENAIGYVGFVDATGVNRLDIAGTCGITTKADVFSVKTEEYPLDRRFYLYNRADNLPADAARFLDYVLSPDADDAVAKAGYVNFAVDRQPQPASRIDMLYDGLTAAAETQLADRLGQDMKDWDRLSTTLRFDTSSAHLGNKEINDLGRLISYLETLGDGTKVAIVGFADDVGGFDRNVTLSARRAEVVAETIASLAGDRLKTIRFEVKAYGELSPALCNDDEVGRRINRRVEIWVHR